MRDEHLNSKAARGLLIIKIPHVKLETAKGARATQVTQSNLACQTRRRNDEIRMTKGHIQSSSFKHSGLFRHSSFVLRYSLHSSFVIFSSLSLPCEFFHIKFVAICRKLV